MTDNTTISIDKRHSKILDKMCKANSCTKKDFMAASILYFERYGVNPIRHESPHKEMDKLIKRIDQVVAFIRQQEKEFLRPACEAIFTSEELIKKSVGGLAGKEYISSLQRQLSEASYRSTELAISKLLHTQEEAFKVLAKLIDAKNRTTVLSDISKIYGQ